MKSEKAARWALAALASSALVCALALPGGALARTGRLVGPDARTAATLPVREAPVAGDDAVTCVAGSSVLIDVLANDTDVDTPHGSLTVTMGAGPAHGTAVLAGARVRYTPEPGYEGRDTFTYSASDGVDFSLLAVVTISTVRDIHVELAGSDATGTGLSDAPMRTVAAAMARARASQNVVVGEGTFDCVNLAIKNGVSLYGAGASVTTLTASGNGRVLQIVDLDYGETVSGVTITGGDTGGVDHGGGVFVRNSSPLIQYCTITGNTVASPTPDPMGPTGGGIVLWNSEATIDQCTISNNAAQLGGGIGSISTSAPRITGTRLTGNVAGNGGGFSAATGAIVTIEDCDISNNTARLSGGGGLFIHTSSITVSATVFSGNAAVSSYGAGGGAMFMGADGRLSDCVFTGGYAQDGGSGVAAFAASTVELANCLLHRNVAAGSAGAMMSSGSAVRVIGCTAADNVGGGFWAAPRGPDQFFITNSVVSGNGYSISGPASVTYSDISGGFAGTGNIDADPLFRDSAAGDYRLRGGSPAIDRAVDGVSPALDRGGVDRPQGVRTDMGAFEYVFTPRSATDDVVATDEDVPVAFNVLANDDPSESTVTRRTAVQLSTLATGTLEAAESGAATYTPPPGWTGDVSFTYLADYETTQSAPATVTITVRAVNDPPQALDDRYTTPEGTLLSVAAPGLLGNDTDANGDALSVFSVSSASTGTLLANALTGAFTYMPPERFAGEATFTYQACEFGTAVTSNGARVTIDVTPVPHPPVATPDSIATLEDTAFRFDPLANDIDDDGDALSARIVRAPRHGSAAVDRETGEVVYTPAANYNGEDSFAYVASDGGRESAATGVSVAIIAVNDAPAASSESVVASAGVRVAIDALRNDSDPEGDTLSAIPGAGASHGSLDWGDDGTAYYVAYKEFTGLDTFEYAVSDGDLTSARAVVAVRVLKATESKKPTDTIDAVDDWADTRMATPVTIDVLENDTDSLEHTLTVAFETQPGHGTVTLGAGGAVVYTPSAEFVGQDTFTYRALCAAANSQPALVTVTVDDAGDPDDGTAGAAGEGGKGGGGLGAPWWSPQSAPLVYAGFTLILVLLVLEVIRSVLKRSRDDAALAAEDEE